MKFLKDLKAYIKKYKVKPTMIVIDISNRCNAECPFCSRQLSSTKLSGLMPREMFYDIMRQVKSIKSIKTIGFAIFGEPMLHPNFDEFVNYAKDLGYRVGFPTNMSLADKHFDTLLKTDFLMISVEGHDRESYEKSRKNLSFDKVYHNITELDRRIKENKAKGLKTPSREINYLINKDSKVEEYIKLWSDYVDIIRVGPILPAMIWDKETKHTKLVVCKELKNSMINCTNYVKDMYCTMPFKTIYVRANGKLSLCCSDYDIDMDFGDCSDILKSYKRNKNLNAIRKEFKTHKLDICKNCFQNYAVTKEELFSMLPDLRSFENNDKVKIYENR